MAMTPCLPLYSGRALYELAFRDELHPICDPTRAGMHPHVAVLFVIVDPQRVDAAATTEEAGHHPRDTELRAVQRDAHQDHRMVVAGLVCDEIVERILVELV